MGLVISWLTTNSLNKVSIGGDTDPAYPNGATIVKTSQRADRRVKSIGLNGTDDWHMQLLTQSMALINDTEIFRVEPNMLDFITARD